MNIELLIKQDLDLGIGILSVAKKYGVGTSKVQKVKEQGRYYFDMNSEEIVFSSKAIKIDEQRFNYICYHNELTNGNLFKYNNKKLFKDRAVNPRLADYLGVSRQNTHRWSKKEQRLFGCNSEGIADRELLEKAQDFLLYETDRFLENRPYEVDEYGYLKGYKLWYIHLSPELLYYGKSYAYYYMNWIKTNKDKNVRDFENYLKEEKYADNEYLYIDARIGVFLGKWIIKNSKKYNQEYIERAIYLKSKPCWLKTDEEYIEEDGMDIEIPPVVYIEKGAYYSGLLTEEQKKLIEKYI